jgi:hypothetical protein
MKTHIYEYNKFNNIAQLLSIELYEGRINYENKDIRYLLWDFKWHVNDLKYYIDIYSYNTAKRTCKIRLEAFAEITS